MICPACSSKTMLIIAWVGGRNSSRQQPNVFAQYRCQKGHYFETLKIFNGTTYDEHYVPFGEPKKDIRTSVN
jgi:hypothetical protein